MMLIHGRGSLHVCKFGILRMVLNNLPKQLATAIHLKLFGSSLTPFFMEGGTEYQVSST